MTKNHAPILGRVRGQCLICGLEFVQAKTGRSRRTSELHRQYLSRITRRQGKPCLRPKWGTGTIHLRANGLWHDGPRGLHLVLIREMSELHFQKPSRRHIGRYEAQRFDVRRKRVIESVWTKVAGSEEVWGSELMNNHGSGVRRGPEGGRQSVRNVTGYSRELLVKRIRVALQSESTVKEIPLDLEDRS